jgi:DNA polymerase III epsilon subunit-like protein
MKAKLLLFFDTETTGVPINYKASFTDTTNWPRMIQLAYMIFKEDGTLVKQYDELIKPVGFVIPAEAERIHGISTQMAVNKGIDLAKAIREFWVDLNQVQTIVAHNMAYDYNIIGAEWVRCGKPLKSEPKEKICTMEATTKFCGIPNGKGGFKWPKLQELYFELFGRNFDNAHNALNDIRATAECYFELKKRGVLIN